MKKLFFSALALYLFTSSASAQVVSVDGFGIDRTSALRDAERSAVATVAGSYIDSRTLVSNGMTELDEIYAKATGFVRSSKILQEGTLNGSYTVKAQVDVDTAPNAALISRLSTIMRLNDPRIAVTVLNGNQHDDTIENALNERLIDMGFSHVIDAKLAASLHDARLLEQIYSGATNYTSIGESLGADFIVVGKLSTEAKNIIIPDFKGGDLDTKLVTGRAVMNVKIIRLSTGEIIETFSVDSKGIQVDKKSASEKAIAELSSKAAAKLEEKFKKIGANSTTAYQIIAYTNNYDKVQQLANDLRSISGVGNVYIREHNGKKAIIEFDSAQTVSTVIQMLKNSSKLSLFVDGTSNGSASIIVN